MTLWTVFTDVCLMGMVFLAGQILRAKVKFFQKFLIPPALIAGFLALIFGPNGFVSRRMTAMGNQVHGLFVAR